MQDKRREATIKYILPNLRNRWPELKAWNDDKLAERYEWFSQSEDFGDNDRLFPEWFKGGY